MPWLTHASAFGETAGAAAAGRWGEGTVDGRASRAYCGLFSSALRHIKTPPRCELRSRGAGDAVGPSRRKREDSTGDRRCKGERTVPRVGSFQRVVRFGQMARSLGFVELVDFGGQDEIALRQTVDLLRPGLDLHFSPCN